MEGLKELTGAVYARFTVEGHEYRLGTLTLADWGEIEAYLLRDRPDPREVVKLMLEGLSVEMQRELLGKAYEDARLGPHLRTGELDDWLRTIEGSQMKFWFALCKFHPAIQRDEAMALHDIYEVQKNEHLMQLMAEIEGLPKNSSGPAEEAESESPSVGQPSSDTSGGPMDGPTQKSDD